MHYQGRDGKYYTIQKVSVFISAFISLLIIGIAKRINETEWSNSVAFILWISLWVLMFAIHHSWFLNKRGNYSYIHYKEYRKYILLFLIIIISSILSHYPF